MTAARLFALALLIAGISLIIRAYAVERTVQLHRTLVLFSEDS